MGTRERALGEHEVSRVQFAAGDRRILGWDDHRIVR